MGKTSKRFDAVIVGGGPAGASCALWLKLLGFNPLIIESKSHVGGLQNESISVNRWIASNPGLRGEEITRVIAKNLKENGVATLLHTSVRSIQKTAGGFLVRHSKGSIRARFVVLASGVRAHDGGFTASKRVLIGPGKQIHAYNFSGKRVAILGGGDNAFENYGFIKDGGAKDVHIYARTMLARREMTARVSKKDVSVGNYRVDERGNSVNDNPYDVLVVMYGWKPQLEYATGLRLKTDTHGFVRTRATTAETSVRDVYAIGELAKRMHPSVVTSMADGVVAAKAIQAKLES